MKILQALAIAALTLAFASVSMGAADEKPVVEQLLDIMRASGQIDDRQHSALLDQARAEQRAAAEAMAAAAEAAPTPAVSAEPDAEAGYQVKASWNGLRVKSNDGEFEIGFGGRIQTDFGVYDQDDSPLGDGMDIRRARLKGFGKLSRDWSFKLEADFEEDGDVQLTDAWLRYTGFKPFMITAGHQKVPFGLQSRSSSNWQVFQERGLTDAFIDNSNTGRRRLGLVTGSHGDYWTFNTGVFAEGVDEAGGSDENFGTAARLVARPFLDEEQNRVLALGGSVYFIDFRRDTDLRFDSKPESNVAGTNVLNTGDFSDSDNLQLYNAEAAFMWGPFHAQGEYVAARIERGGSSDLDFDGFYVQAGLFLTGESRNYDKKSASFKRVYPKKNFGRGPDGWGWGAWEMAIRYSHLDLSDAEVRGGEMDDVSVGLNWWVNPSVMFRLGYVYSNPDPSSEETLNGVEEDIHVFQGRAQVVF